MNVYDYTQELHYVNIFLFEFVDSAELAVLRQLRAFYHVRQQISLGQKENGCHPLNIG